MDRKSNACVDETVGSRSSSTAPCLRPTRGAERPRVSVAVVMSTPKTR